MRMMLSCGIYCVSVSVEMLRLDVQSALGDVILRIRSYVFHESHNAREQRWTGTTLFVCILKNQHLILVDWH